jgi:hypothetical protein
MVQQFSANDQPRRAGTHGNGKPAATVRRTDLSRLLDDEVYPRLYDQLPAAFPEFGFVQRGGSYVATTWPADFPLEVNHPNPDRLACYPNSRFGVMCHGHHLIPWTSYLNRGVRPTGEDFIVVVRQLCRLVGVALPEQVRTPEEVEACRRWEKRRGLLAAVVKIGQAVLWACSEEARAARAFLNERGFSDEDIRALGLGLIRPSAR